MTPFTLKNSSAEPIDYGALLSTLQRTGAQHFHKILSAGLGAQPQVGAQPPGAILAHLERPPGQIRALVKAWDEIAKNLPPPALSAAERKAFGRAPLAARCGWVRPLADGLTATPAFEAAVGVKGAVLASIVDRDIQIRALHRNAELAKDGAMDLRALTGAYGFFLISSVLDWLRDRVSKVSEAEANTLLRDFAPLLVLIGQLIEEEEKARAARASAREKAQAEAAEAEKAARKAETRAALRTGQPVSDEDLKALLDAEDPPAAAPKGRSSRR
jgi:hypothetical protein